MLEQTLIKTINIYVRRSVAEEIHEKAVINNAF